MGLVPSLESDTLGSGAGVLNGAFWTFGTKGTIGTKLVFVGESLAKVDVGGAWVYTSNGPFAAVGTAIAQSGEAAPSSKVGVF